MEELCWEVEEMHVRAEVLERRVRKGERTERRDSHGQQQLVGLIELRGCNILQLVKPLRPVSLTERLQLAGKHCGHVKLFCKISRTSSGIQVLWGEMTYS